MVSLRAGLESLVKAAIVLILAAIATAASPDPVRSSRVELKETFTWTGAAQKR